MENRRDNQHHGHRPSEGAKGQRRRLLAVAASLLLHLLFGWAFASVVVVPAPAPREGIRAVLRPYRTALPPLPDPQAVMGAHGDHTARTDEPALRQHAHLPKPTLAAAPPPRASGPAKPLPAAGEGAVPAGVAAAALAPALVGRRGALTAQVHLFASIDRVRSGTAWFAGEGRVTSDQRFATYRFMIPGTVIRPQALPGLEERPWIGIDYHGTIEWPEQRAGVYAFRLTSDAPAILQIDGEDVIDHDGLHPFRPFEGQAVLSPGPHTVRFAFLLGPETPLGIILHYRPLDERGWRIFDLRPLLRETAPREPDPLAPGPSAADLARGETGGIAASEPSHD